ncbi:MAG: hypothetical protein DMF56_22555 [Acidobacteria bacterium]|nr:MAG: hypothetical protein DMF56_22555 [Acidobacteriota bacterium]
MIAVLAAVFSLTAGHAIAIDEVEFFRAARWVGEGQVPFRDFWEHHTPLQWFVFAPFARVAWGEGVGALLAMRWLQLPFWIATFAMLWSLMSTRERWARWVAIALPLTSWTFLQKAIEFRVDTLGCFFVVAALWLMQRRRMFWAGVALSLAVLANLRLAPVVAVAALIPLFRHFFVVTAALSGHTPRSGAMRRATAEAAVATKLLACGALLVAAIALAYLTFTSSLNAAWQQVFVETAAANRLLPFQASMFFSKLAALATDPGGIFVWILGLAGVVIALRRRTEHAEWVFAALLVVAIASIAAMRVSYAYHFEIVVVLFVPFIAIAVQAMAEQQRAIAIVLVASLAVSVWNSVFRAQDAELAAQHATIRFVHERTQPGDRVFDAVGYAWKRRPAWRYWFVPLMVHMLDRTLTVAELRDANPAAVIADYRMSILLSRHADLARYLTSHYVPVLRNAWLPGMSARIDAHRGAEWIVPASGEYRVYASPLLARHPWFARPLLTGAPAMRDVPIEILLAQVPASAVVISVDGKPAQSPLRLQRGSIVRASAGEAMGVFLVRGNETALFRDAGPFDVLDQLPAPHVPSWQSR